MADDLLLESPPAYQGNRKHSSGDLHSRLKTRKLLGVGETDDGDVHRSKLSQILGHSEQLYVKLPRGLKIWQFTLALMFLIMGLWAVIFPQNLLNYALPGEDSPAVQLPVRLYGAALIGLSMIFWSTIQATDRDIIRWSLLASVVYFTIQIIVTSLTLLEQRMFLVLAPRLLSHRLLFSVISATYYFLLGQKVAVKIRKSNSSKDLPSEVN